MSVLVLPVQGCRTPPPAATSSGPAETSSATAGPGPAPAPNGRLTPDPAGRLAVVGVCEASGAEWVPDGGGGHLIIADDDQDRGLLEAWPGRAQGGVTTAVAAPLGWKMKDMEGLALDSAGDLWISSSGSRKSDGSFDDGRLSVARWRPGQGGGPMATLRQGEGDDLSAVVAALADPRCPGCQLAPGFAAASPDAGGFNVEGLAVLGDHLIVGLRAPQTTDGRALLLEAPPPTVSGGAMAWSGAVALDLGGRGVRALETSADGATLLVLGGPGAGPVAGDPNVLYAWRPGGAATALGSLPDEAGGVPEAITADAQGGLWVLYDAGDAIKAASGGRFECEALAARDQGLARVIAQRYTLDLSGL